MRCAEYFPLLCSKGVAELKEQYGVDLYHNLLALDREPGTGSVRATHEDQPHKEKRVGAAVRGLDEKAVPGPVWPAAGTSFST